MTNREAANFIKNHILYSVKNDISPLYRSKKVFFAIPREVYAYIEYLAKLNDGKDTKITGVVDFIKTYFPKSNPWYQKIPYTLSVMLRHGGFHYVSPKVVRIKGLEVVAVLGRGSSADSFKFQGVMFNHLEPKDALLSDIEFWAPIKKQRVRGRVRALWIPVSLKALYRDLKVAINNYKKEVLKNPNKVKNLEDGLTLISTPESEAQLQKRFGFDKNELNALKANIKTI